MCGINGIFVPPGQASEGLATLISNMNDKIAHRGPDGDGVWVNESATLGLGHRRLSIIELSNLGHQPMHLPNGTTIVFNGEIYNYRELKAELSTYPFKSDSDTELILALYALKGERCLDDLIGMFAFAIWDPKKKGVFVARDRIGKKPFYYSQHGSRFAFSSELRSILSLPWVTPKIGHEAFYNFLTFGFVPPPSTMFEGIQKLECGHCMWIGQDGPTAPQPYWHPTQIDMPSDEASIIKQLNEKFERSMDLRMVSDVPVGVFLSGGVDSTAVATHMRHRTDNDITSFSISFADQPDYDEADDARATAQRLGLDHHERVIGPQDMRDMLGKIANVLDEPLADPTCIPLYFLSQMASTQKTKVILTGDGPDELLLGYRNWQSYIKAYPHFRRYSALPKCVKKLGLIAAKSPFISTRFEELLSRAHNNQEFFWGKAPSFKESEKGALLSENFRRESQNWDAHNVIAAHRRSYDKAYRDAATDHNSADANWMAYIGLRFNIPNFYMLRADRLGMQHGVELRAPFLDHDFANFALSIPSSFKIEGGEPKSILKKALAGTVPDSVLYRRKKGFCVPLREWGADLMVNSILDQLDGFCREFDFLSKDAITQQVNALKNGDSSATNNVWTLFFIIEWANQWINKH